MRIALRVDASAMIGTGHLRRCLALAHALSALGAQLRFVTRDLGLDSASMIAQQGFADTVTLPAPDAPCPPDPAIPHAVWAGVSQSQDSAATIAALEGFVPDWVIVDSYAFDGRWHAAVRAGLGCRIAAIDEVPDRRLASDLLIDQTCASDHRAKYAGHLPAETRLLAGPRHALLGPAYAAATRHAFRPEVRSIGIFMGGVDAGQHSAAALDAVDLAGFAGPVEIVTTAANPKLAALEQRVAARPHTRLLVDLPDLAGFFARHDLQIGAGGGATWERCCIGAPTLLVVVAANQTTLAPFLAEAGVVALADEPTGTGIAAALRPLLTNPARRRALAETARQLVDGEGANRCALALMADGLRLRPATAGDAEALFDWRNDEATRAVSRDQGPLDWERHVAWLDSVLADLARRLFVGMIGPRAVGVIRFDRTGADEAEVSLYLDPALHGLGLGEHLLRAGEAAAGAGTIAATVLEGNHASQRLFARCGYRQHAPGQWFKHTAVRVASGGRAGTAA